MPRAKSLDWDKLIKISEHSKISPLIFSALKKLPEETGIPQKHYQYLNDSYRLNLIRNKLLLEESRALCSLLCREGVEVVLLKGIALLRTVYAQQIAYRRMEDVDLLIKEQDRKKAGRILENLGYSPLQGEGPGRKALMYFKYNPDGSALMPVHLHWHIVNLSPAAFTQSCNSINMNDIWLKSKIIDPGLAELVLIMPPEHFLLALSEHAFRHGFSRLALLYDIHLLIKHYEHALDWDLLARTAKCWGLAGPLYLGLALSRDLFATALPQDFLRQLRPRGHSLLEKLYILYLSQSDFPSDDMCGILYLALQRNCWDKLKFLKNISLLFLDKYHIISLSATHYN